MLLIHPKYNVRIRSIDMCFLLWKKKIVRLFITTVIMAVVDDFHNPFQVYPFTSFHPIPFSVTRFKNIIKNVFFMYVYVEPHPGNFHVR